MGLAVSIFFPFLHIKKDLRNRNEFGLLSQIEQLKQKNEILIKALEIAANQLEGCSLAIKTHGQNINVDFFIDHYEQSAKNAREALLKTKKP